MAACGVALVLVVARFAARRPRSYVAVVAAARRLADPVAGSTSGRRCSRRARSRRSSPDRDRLGWGLLGAAVAAKLWPLVLVPLALVWSARRGRLPAALAGLVVVAAVFLPFAVLAPHGLWVSVRGQLSRPLERARSG